VEQDISSTLCRARASSKPKLSCSKPAKKERSESHPFDPRHVILIGASTGGIDALLKVIKTFDITCPPILIVQHTGGQFAKSLIRLLDGACRAKVLTAIDGMALAAGSIYLAPDDQSHMVLSANAKPRIRLDQSATLSGHRPSIDALFTSATNIAPHVSAALLTGMGKDGAAGLTELRSNGAYTIGQDEQTSVVYGMPRVAMEMGGVCEQLPLNSIGPALLRSCKAKVRT
jgi:two-component system chemotaxis response regulator CheB